MRSVIFISLLLLTGCSSGDRTIAAGNELSDIQPLWDTMIRIYKTPGIDRRAIENLETLIIKKIIIARSLNPNISELTGSALEGLCAAFQYSESPMFIENSPDPELSKLVGQYLSSVKSELLGKVTELKNTIWTPDKCPI